MHSSQTKNYKLPMWQFGDHVEFMGDFNPAFETIDTTMKETSDSATDSAEQIKVLQPIVSSNTSAIEQNTQNISSTAVRLTNAEHDIQDNQQNIAQNAADIKALQEEDHSIHTDMANDRANFYTQLNWTKLYEHKTFYGNGTIGSTTCRFKIELCGDRIAVAQDSRSTSFNFVKGLNTIRIDSPDLQNAAHNMSAAISPLTPIVFTPTSAEYVLEGFAQLLPVTITSNKMELHVWVNEAKTNYQLPFNYFISCTINYDELTAAENAINTIPPMPTPEA